MIDADHMCCRVPPTSLQYVPCGTSCCCVASLNNPHNEYYPPHQIVDTRVEVDINGIHRELIELNKHFRRYFRKSRKKRKR